MIGNTKQPMVQVVMKQRTWFIESHESKLLFITDKKNITVTSLKTNKREILNSARINLLLICFPCLIDKEKNRNIYCCYLLNDGSVT